MTGVWTGGPDDVWVIGLQGGIYHWDGVSWTQWEAVSPEGEERLVLTAIWGDGQGQLWVAGRQAEPRVDPYPYVDEYRPGALLHYDGTGWTRRDACGCEWVSSIWGSASNDVWFAGDDLKFLRWDGTGLRSHQVQEQGSVFAIWGTGPGDIRGVGWEGSLAHWDGSRWGVRSWQDEHTADCTPFGRPPAESLWGVWGSAPDDYWAVGECGAVLRLQGERWERVVSGLGVGTSAGELYALGGLANGQLMALRSHNWGFGTVIQGDGASWGGAADYQAALARPKGPYALDPGQDWFPKDLTVGPTGDIWVAGTHGLIVRMDGETGLWSRDDGGFNIDVQDIWPAPDGEVWAVGYATHEDRYDGGTGRIIHFGGRQPGIERIAHTANVHQIVGMESGDMWVKAHAIKAPGEEVVWGPLFRRDPVQGEWVHVEIPSGGSAVSPCAVAPDTLWVGTSEGVAHRWDGQGWWTSDTLGPGTVWPRWGSSSSDVWVLVSGSEETGAEGYLGHWDGSGWTKWTENVMWGAYAGSGPADVWGVSGALGVSHFDGAGWTHWPASDREDPRGHSIAVHSSKEAWIVVNEGRRMYEWDGTSWHRRDLTALHETSPYEGPQVHVVVPGPDAFWVGGVRGAILRRPYRTAP